jgi:hypothetical protein
MNTDKSTDFLICVHLCHSVAHSAFAKALRRDLSAFAEALPPSPGFGETGRRDLSAFAKLQRGKSHLVKPKFACGLHTLAWDRVSFPGQSRFKSCKMARNTASYREIPANTGIKII